MRHLIIAVAVCCLAVAGCSREPEPAAKVGGTAPAVEWQPVTASAMTPTQKAQQELVAAATNAMVAEVFGELQAGLASGGELGALLPIRLRAECEMCHGPVESITEDIHRAIDTFYPNDQAVGFVEGDLRGWVWVEVPPGTPETAL